MGRVALVAPPRALAVLRLQPALAAAAAAVSGPPRRAVDKELLVGPAPELRVGSMAGAVLVPRRPDWWPPAWGHEDTGDAAAEAAAG